MSYGELKIILIERLYLKPGIGSNFDEYEEVFSLFPEIVDNQKTFTF